MKHVRRVVGGPAPANLAIIPGHEGYGITPDGRVWSRKGNGRGGLRSDWKEVRKILHPNGYYYVTISTPAKPFRMAVHRLVVEAFIGPIPEGMVTNHINHNTTDNRVENLEIVTYTGNFLHSMRAGRRAHLMGTKAFHFDQGVARKEASKNALV